jgi:IS30 family transposase
MYKDFVRSLTFDNGTEFYEHKMIAKRRQADFFFAPPYSSWEKGLNEYTNKLLRQYIPNPDKPEPKREKNRIFPL